MVRILRSRIPIIFRCTYSHGALILDGKLGKPLCENSKSWQTTGELVAPDRIKVTKGGYCSGCGYMGDAMIPDQYKGCTVEVSG